MSERKRIYLCLAHMSEDGMEQKYVKEAFDTNWVVPLGPNVNGFVYHTDRTDYDSGFMVLCRKVIFPDYKRVEII